MKKKGETLHVKKEIEPWPFVRTRQTTFQGLESYG